LLRNIRGRGSIICHLRHYDQMIESTPFVHGAKEMYSGNVLRCSKNACGARIKIETKKPFPVTIDVETPMTISILAF